MQEQIRSKYFNSNMKILFKQFLLYLFLIACLTYSFGNINNLLPIHLVDLWYYLILLFIIAFYRVLPKNSLFIYLLAYVIFSTFVMNFGNVDIRTLKTFLKIFIYSVSTIYLLQSFKENPQTILKRYIILCTIFGVVGYIQFIGFYIKIPFLYDFSFMGTREPAISNGSIRISSFATEPAWLTQIMLPATYLSIGRLFFKDEFSSLFVSRKKAIFFLILGIISKSTLFFMILPLFFLSFALRNNFLKAIKLTIIGIIGFVLIFPIIYKYSYDFKYRVDSISTLSVEDKNSDNLSVFAMLSNVHVTSNSVKSNPIWGSGIDSHRLNYEKYIGELYNSKEVRMELNSKDAGSFFLRLPSEFGLLATLLLIILFFKKYKEAKLTNNNYFFLFFFCFLAFCLRNGQYLNPFFQLYFWGAFINYKTAEN